MNLGAKSQTLSEDIVLGAVPGSTALLASELMITPFNYQDQTALVPRTTAT